MTTWKTDPSGVHHGTYLNREGHVSTAAEVAIATRPVGACWFWFNGTPAPMSGSDTALKLTERWIDWRHAYQTDAVAFLDKIAEWTKADGL